MKVPTGDGDLRQCRGGPCCGELLEGQGQYLRVPARGHHAVFVDDDSFWNTPAAAVPSLPFHLYRRGCQWRVLREGDAELLVRYPTWEYEGVA